jgi:hypothetical protein
MSHPKAYHTPIIEHHNKNIIHKPKNVSLASLTTVSQKPPSLRIEPRTQIFVFVVFVAIITSSKQITLFLFRIVFWDVLPCKIIVDRRFKGTYCLQHHPWWWRQYVPLKRRSTIILQGRTSQKTILNFILAAVRTWNLTSLFLALFFCRALFQLQIPRHRDANSRRVFGVVSFVPSNFLETNNFVFDSVFLSLLVSELISWLKLPRK